MSEHKDMLEQEKGMELFDDDTSISLQREDSEQATISIEKQGDERMVLSTINEIPHRPRHRWLRMLMVGFTSALLCIMVWGGWRVYSYYYRIGVPISVTPDENIAKLAKPFACSVKPEVVFTADSILGVGINFYELKNLRAELSLTEPDSTDTAVWMYSRCADYTSDGKYLGSLVMNGKELASDVSRLGYCAMADGNVVIGISRSDKVKDWCLERGGSFFRQFILVSGGTIPAKFYLHGKVERRALGRMSDDRLYYIETRHAETLWDFADALREYGFVDAIYITGGNSRSFYRSADGKVHNIGEDNQQPYKEYKNIVPWLVFKAR